uniref:C2H2-type domain-containing protein n=1 Tax=Meleagris gallopavo TaxID=9103 RepID=A0A803YDW7_MELGA
QTSNATESRPPAPHLPTPLPPPAGFTTAAYLRVHAAKDHGSTQPHGARSLRCRLCGVHCATAAQLRGHLQTHGPAHD